MDERPPKPPLRQHSGPVEKAKAAELTPEASAALAAAAAALSAFDPAKAPEATSSIGAPASGPPKLIDLFPPGADASAPGPAQTPPPFASAPYARFYGLSGDPFDLAPDPRFHFHWISHDKTLRDFAAALGRHDGTLLLTGEAGAGKTTLCRALVAQLGRRTLVSFVGETAGSARDVLETVLIDFGVVSRADAARLHDASTQELAATLRTFLSSLSALQSVALVVLDGAHKLPAGVLADLQVLSEMAMEHKLLQVLLVGEPGLTEDLRRAALQPWDRRIRVRAELRPLAAGDMADYVAHRLAVAGTTDNLIEEGAIARIHELSRGVPRTVNVLCDRALAIGARASARAIDASLVDRAARELGLLPDDAPGPPGSSWRGRVLVLLLMLGLMFAGAAAAWMFRDPLARALAAWLPRYGFSLSR